MAGAQLEVAGGRVLGGGRPGPVAEDHGLGQGVAAQSVGPVQPGGHLTDGIQADHVRSMGLGVDHHPAHRVVGGWGHLHRLAGDVQHLQLQELPVHPRQPLQDVVFPDVADVQEHAAVGAATTSAISV